MEQQNGLWLQWLIYVQIIWKIGMGLKHGWKTHNRPGGFYSLLSMGKARRSLQWCLLDIRIHFLNIINPPIYLECNEINSSCVQQVACYSMVTMQYCLHICRVVVFPLSANFRHIDIDQGCGRLPLPVTQQPGNSGNVTWRLDPNDA